MHEYALAPDLLPSSTPHQQAVRAFVMGRNTPRSRETAIWTLQRIAHVLGYADILACPWCDLDRQRLLDLRYRLQHASPLDRPVKPETINAYMTVLKGLARHSLDNEIGDAQRWQSILRFKPIQCEPGGGVGRALTGAEMTALLAACTDDERGARNRFLLRFLWATGLRISTVLSLTLDNISRGEPMTVTCRTKGNKVHSVTLHGSVVKAFEEYMAVRGEWAGVLFCGVSHGCPPHRLVKRPLTISGVRRILLALAEDAGIEPVTPHTFRYTAITQWISLGGLRAAQLLAGHSEPGVTARYDKAEQERMRAVVMARPLPDAAA